MLRFLYLHFLFGRECRFHETRLLFPCKSRIETVIPYTADFDELRDVNHMEMQQGVLPELKESNLDISAYNTVFVGYPVWETDVPQAVTWLVACGNKKLLEVFMMKKTIAILLSLIMILGLAACGNSASRTEQSSTEENPVESTASMEESVEGSNTNMENTDASEVQSENTDIPESQTEETDAPDVQESKVLVAYFSATGTTEGVAEHIANGLNADIYEIVPEEPYTDADLNYNDNNSRTTIEMTDPDARPAISGSVEDMDQYTTVFIGYPIWWGDAPRIISTFMESYDFSGKTIVPFCTSGGSGIGSSASNLEQLTSGATWLSGRRLNGSDSQDTVMEWVNSLGLNFEE